MKNNLVEEEGALFILQGGEEGNGEFLVIKPNWGILALLNVKYMVSSHNFVKIVFVIKKKNFWSPLKWQYRCNCYPSPQAYNSVIF
jgi:hypothetical protein